jgi:hypothetical protein
MDNKPDEPQKIVPQQDIDAWNKLFPDEIPERPNNRPMERPSDWLDIDALFRR